MSYLTLILASALVLLSFLVFTWFESRRGARVFSGIRSRMDKRVARISYIAKHVDWEGFFAHIFKLALERVAHDVVHGILVLVRTMERTLTGAIKNLRERVAHRSSGEVPVDGSQLAEMVRKFKKNLQHRERPAE